MAIGLQAWLVASQRRLAKRAMPGPELVGRTVVVNTHGDTAVRGVVYGQYADRWTLRQATFLAVGSDAEAPAGGLVHIPTRNVSTVQELEPPGIRNLQARGASPELVDAAKRGMQRRAERG